MQQHREVHPPSKRIRRTAPKSPGPPSPHPLRKSEVSNRFRIWVAPRSRYALVPKRRDGSIFLWICKANLHAPVVGGDAGHSRSRRRSVTDVGLSLAGTHRPSRSHRFFMKNSGKFATSQWADRVVGPYNDPRSPPVGADASCPPAGCTDFTGIFGEFAASQRAGRAAGPYRTPANPYCPANFDCKAGLPQQFKRNYLQVRCTVTGGADHSGGRRRLVEKGLDGTSLRCSRSLVSCLGCI